MHYYWPGLDYVKWLFFAAGAWSFFLMNSEEVGRKRGLLKLTGCVLIAAGAICWGISGILFNRYAPHLTAEGHLSNLVVQGGKGASTSFRLLTPSGEIDNLSLDKAVRWVHERDQARVIYQDESHAVLSLALLDGSYAGDVVLGNDGSFGSWCALICGLVLAGYGVLDWLNDGTAIPPPEDNRAAPDGDVDTKSMLDLSHRD